MADQERKRPLAGLRQGLDAARERAGELAAGAAQRLDEARAQVEAGVQRVQAGVEAGVQRAQEIGADLVAGAQEKARAIDAKGVDLAKKVTWGPAGILIQTYDMSSQMGLQGQEQAAFQAYVAAKLGEQAGPLADYLAERFTTMSRGDNLALPAPEGTSSTEVVPYGSTRRDPSVSSGAELGIHLLKSVVTHYLARSSREYEREIPQTMQIDPSLFPHLQDAAGAFVGTVSGDAVDLLQAPHSKAAMQILQQHKGAVQAIAQQYRVR